MEGRSELIGKTYYRLGDWTLSSSYSFEFSSYYKILYLLCKPFYDNFPIQK